MPLPQLLSALMEHGANALLRFDTASDRRLARLDGRAINLELTDLHLALGLVVRADGLMVMGPQEGADASLRLPLSALDRLKDPAQLPAAIRDGALELDGDPMLLKGFSELFSKLDVDWEGELARYLGDVPAHLLFKAGRTLSVRLKAAASGFGQWSSEQLTEEARLTPHRLEQRAFFDQVDDLRSDSERLLRRLEALEARS
ncbi:SCP2 sterol-binding domain-containing protein [Gallaecimonas sp. GXIMD4217]|uniref:ubiquinone biosynthesis accessory factor UbiJ n=1 Tax=Gallaecimonas sp. GXIMD4217 TaxID=3131927 RepID=UPI00311AC890